MNSRNEENNHDFESRKADHIRLALDLSNQSSIGTGFESIQLHHEALPDFDFQEVDLSSSLLGKLYPTPFFISSMTAGHSEGIAINRCLMSAASKSHWPMGVGSQRKQLWDELAQEEWKVLRRDFPSVTLFANLGITQIIDCPIAKIEQLVSSINAAALIVHLNPLQEVIQKEGTPHFRGSHTALKDLSRHLSVPVIVKETGSGMGFSTLKLLSSFGLAAIDVSGLGGTHWGRIEGSRASQDSVHQKASRVFADWGFSTYQSLIAAKKASLDCEVWASGGIRNGLQAAKSLALGANAVGFAQPALKSALEGESELLAWMRQMEFELKVAMFCSGSRKLSDLREKLV
jgi:isopentenyl-diphosphate delta-isomerase